MMVGDITVAAVSFCGTVAEAVLGAVVGVIAGSGVIGEFIWVGVEVGVGVGIGVVGVIGGVGVGVGVGTVVIERAGAGVA